MLRLKILLSLFLILFCAFVNPGHTEDKVPSATELTAYAHDLKTYNPECLQPFTDLILHDIGMYRVNISKRIVEAWSFFENSTTSSPILKMVIQKDGNLSELMVVSSSGNSELDQKAMNALRAIAPFPPLPSNYPFPERDMIVDYQLMRSLTIEDVDRSIDITRLSSRMNRAIRRRYKVVNGVGDRMGVILAQINLDTGKVVNKRILVTSCVPQYDAQILSVVDQAEPFRVLEREKKFLMPKYRILSVSFVFKQSFSNTPPSYYPLFPVIRF